VGAGRRDLGESGSGQEKEKSVHGLSQEGWRTGGK
jgi:hypothetical protein